MKRKYTFEDYSLRVHFISPKIRKEANGPNMLPWVGYFVDWPQRHDYSIDMHATGNTKKAVIETLRAKFAAFLKTKNRLPTQGVFSWDKVLFLRKNEKGKRVRSSRHVAIFEL